MKRKSFPELDHEKSSLFPQSHARRVKLLFYANLPLTQGDPSPNVRNPQNFMTCAEYFPGKTAVSWKRGLLSLIVYNESCEKKCQPMGRRKFIGGQFSSNYQPAKKLKSEEKPDENSCSVGGQDSATTTPESVFLKFASELARIDKLSRECKRLTSENAGLKRTIQTLRKSIGKNWLRKTWVNV